jgi:transposase
MSWDNFNESGDLQQFDIKPATKMVNFKDVKKGDYLEMAAYSIDLRQKILSAWQNKEGTQRELAKQFKVSLSFLRDFLRRYRETGQIAARTQGGDRRSKLKGKEQELLKIIVTKKSDIYLREIHS